MKRKMVSISKEKQKRSIEALKKKKPESRDTERINEMMTRAGISEP